jgi:hypothetical protein
MSTYFFIVTFSSIPQKPNQTLAFFTRLKRNAVRGWYWLIGVLFVVTTLSAIVISYRMVSSGVKGYGG